MYLHNLLILRPKQDYVGNNMNNIIQQLKTDWTKSYYNLPFVICVYDLYLFHQSLKCEVSNIEIIVNSLGHLYTVIDEFLTFLDIPKKPDQCYLMPKISWQNLIIKEMSDISAQVWNKELQKLKLDLFKNGSHDFEIGKTIQSGSLRSTICHWSFFPYFSWV